MPLDQHIESGHGEREPGVEIRPDPMHDLFEMADERQHREDRLDEHTVLPLATLTEFEVGGITFCRMEGGITQDNHAFFKRNRSGGNVVIISMAYRLKNSKF